MKSFAYPRQNTRTRSGKTAVFVGLVATLATLAALGCTSRKQYAINEAILISERRQLEDEIYRTKFELRDALKENESLRKQLEEEMGGSSKAKTGKTAARKPSLDAERYPGGARLNVDSSQTAPSYQNMMDPDRYDNSAPKGSIETLPDFVPIKSKAAQQDVRGASNVAASREKRFGVSRPVAAVELKNAPANGNAGQPVAQSQNEKVKQVVYEEHSGDSAPGFEVESVEEEWSPINSY